METQKKTLIKEVIRGLHAGLAVEQAKEKILREVGPLSSAEIMEVEQSLIEEGVDPQEIKAFCNVHALLFESSLAESVARNESPSHPLNLLRSENEQIAGILEKLKASLAEKGFEQALAGVKARIADLKGVARHYALKENALFPFIEKHGFTGPSQVMWAKHNDIRELIREAEARVASVKNAGELSEARRSVIDKLVEEVLGMIFKEENILFPAAQEKLSQEEWVKVLESFHQIGPVYAQLSPLDLPLSELAQVQREAGETSSLIELGSGKLSFAELSAVLNALPVDISFVDAQDKVRFFNQSPERIFPRSVSVIGRSVQNCHPPQSVHKVNAILDSFRRNERHSAEFWISLSGKFVSIRYFAVHGENGRYLGCLEVCQDLTRLRALEGERRLLDDGQP